MGYFVSRISSPPGQQLRIISYHAVWMNIFEAAWKYMERGTMGPMESAAYMSSACSTFTAWPRSILIWGMLKDAFASGYVAHVEAQCPALKDVGSS